MPRIRLEHDLLGERRVVKARLAVDFGRHFGLDHQGTRGARRDGNVVKARHLRDGQRVAGHLGNRLIARHDRDREDVHVRIACGEQDGGRVVVAGVAVEDDVDLLVFGAHVACSLRSECSAAKIAGLQTASASTSDLLGIEVAAPSRVTEMAEAFAARFMAVLKSSPGHTAAGAPAAECEDEVHVRIPALEKRHQAGGLNAFGLVGQKAPRLGLVDDERVEPFERRLEKRSVEGRRIEDGAQTTFERSFDKARSVGELVLQHHDVVLLAGVERKQHALHRHAAVGAGIVEDAVLAVLRHLDEGVAARLGLVHGQHRDVDAFALEHFKKHTAVGTHATRMEDRRSRASKRHRLVETLATRMHGAVRGRKRLAGTHEVVDAIDVVKVERADVEDCHVRCRQ